MNIWNTWRLNLLNTVNFCCNEQLDRDRPILFVITGVRYNRVNLCTKMTNLTSKCVRYNRVFVNNRVCFNQLLLYGSRQTSNFCEQYCDKNTKRHWWKDKKTFFQQYFFSSCELKISIHGYFSWFWNAKAIFCQKIIALSQYRFISISLAKIPHLPRA
jgi:hypothetical protein